MGKDEGFERYNFATAWILVFLVCDSVIIKRMDKTEVHHFLGFEMTTIIRSFPKDVCSGRAGLERKKSNTTRGLVTTNLDQNQQKTNKINKHQPSSINHQQNNHINIKTRKSHHHIFPAMGMRPPFFPNQRSVSFRISSSPMDTSAAPRFGSSGSMVHRVEGWCVSITLITFFGKTSSPLF